MYTVMQETLVWDEYHETARIRCRSYLRALVVAKRLRGSCTRWTNPTQWAYIDGHEVPPRIVPSVGELGYW